MSHITRDDLYRILLDSHLLPELKNGPTAVMLSHDGKPCSVSLEYSHGDVIARSDSFTYTYRYPDDRKEMDPQ